MNKIIRIGLALLVLATVSVTNARAEDAIAAWNQISETAVKTAGHPPPVAALDFAIVHLAIYDAVESIERRYEPYYTLAPGAIGSPSAAAAKAGHDVLVGLFPAQSQTLDAAYANFLAANGVDPLDPATAVGAQAAANILALRSNDGRFPLNPPPFLGSTAIGQWQPTPSLLGDLRPRLRRDCPLGWPLYGRSRCTATFWRPITAIRLGDRDGNPATEGDADWQPLIDTPNFPEYPSGHAAISAAISNALRLFFRRDELSFQMTTTNPTAPQRTRSFTRLSQAEEEVVDARVYVGIHYRNSDNTARAQGQRVSNWIFRHYFRQVERRSDGDEAKNWS